MDVPELISKAIDLANEGRKDEALACCDQALAVEGSPFSGTVWAIKGKLFQNAKQYREALGWFKKAQELGEASAADGIAICQKALGEDAAPAGQPARATAGTAADAEALFYKGEALMNQGQATDAVACFDKALEINPQSAYTWYSRGVALGQLDRPQDEIASYDQALKINPKFPEAWYNKAITLGNARRFREALVCFEKAKELDYPDADQGIRFCQNALAEAAGGETAESAEWLQKGTDLIVNGGDPKEALACFEKSLAINPHSERACWGKGLQLDKLGRLEEALAAFDQASAIDPSATGPMMSKAATLYNASRFQDALVCYEKARELGNPTAIQGVVTCRMALGRPVTG